MREPVYVKGFIEDSVVNGKERQYSYPPDGGVPDICVDEMEIKTSFLVALENEGVI